MFIVFIACNLLVLVSGLDFGKYNAAEVYSQQRTRDVLPNLNFVKLDPEEEVVKFRFQDEYPLSIVPESAYLTVFSVNNQQQGHIKMEMTFNTTGIQFCILQYDVITYCRPQERIVFRSLELNRAFQNGVEFLVYIPSASTALVSMDWRRSVSAKEQVRIQTILQSPHQVLQVDLISSQIRGSTTVTTVDDHYTQDLNLVFLERLSESGLVKQIQEFYKDLIFEDNAPRRPIQSYQDSMSYFPGLKLKEKDDRSLIYRYDADKSSPVFLPQHQYVEFFQFNHGLGRIKLGFSLSGTCEAATFYQESGDKVRLASEFMHRMEIRRSGGIMQLRFWTRIYKAGTKLLFFVPMGCYAQLIQIKRELVALTLFQVYQCIKQSDRRIRLDGTPSCLREENGVVPFDWVPSFYLQRCIWTFTNLLSP